MIKLCNIVRDILGDSRQGLNNINKNLTNSVF